MSGKGRPVGWRKEKSEMRPARTLRAFDDEWFLIKKFAALVKRGDKVKAEKILSQLIG